MTLVTPRHTAVILVATLLGVAATVRLGVWQLDRAAAKLAMQAQIDGRRGLSPLANAALPSTSAAAAAQHYRRVILRGRWVGEATVYLDNRQMNGKPGFLVVTPLQLEGRSEAVAVERGWVPRDFNDRTHLPSLTTPPGPTSVEGLVAPPPSRLYEFGADAGGPIRQNLELDAFARETRLTLLPLSVLQSRTALTTGDGLLREWPLPAVDVQKHYGYAFQWFALAATMTALYVWFQLIRPARRRPA